MKFVPYQQRHGDPLAGFEAALDRYFEAELRVLEAAAQMQRTLQEQRT